MISLETTIWNEFLESIPKTNILKQISNPPKFETDILNFHHYINDYVLDVNNNNRFTNSK